MNLPSYLEPVYLDERMLLNVAAYLFEDPSKREEVIEEIKKKAGMRAGFGLSMFGLGEVGGEAGRESVVQHKYTREASAGALHMDLIGALLEDKHLEVVASANDINSYIVRDDRPPYVALRARSLMSDYPALLHTVKIGMPVASAIATVVQRPAGNQKGSQQGSRGNKSGQGKAPNTIANWLKANQTEVSQVASDLENDYYSAGTAQLVLTDTSDKDSVFGVVDFAADSQLAGRDISSKLSGGHYWIIGKVVEAVDHSGSISLIQRTALSTLMGLFENLATSGILEHKLEPEFNIKDVLSYLNQFIRVQVDGPAIRIVALSACI